MQKSFSHPKKILTLLIVCIALLMAGCSIGTSPVDNGQTPSEQPGITDAELDTLFITELSGPTLPSSEKPSESICTDYTSRGLLRICYTNDTDAKLKLQVMMGDHVIAYDLKGDGSNEDFPLQFGNGEYTARIMQNIQNDEYYAVESCTFDVAIANDNDVYLNSVQNINWNYAMAPIQDVRYIISRSLTNPDENDLDFSCAEDLYNYVIENIQYDPDKIFNILYNYLPDIQKTYADGTGICYDYASLFAAMLRSINIPAKLVKGYASYNPDVYHAWNEVYIDGKWIVIDTTKDSSSSGIPTQIQKSSTDYTTVYEY